MEVRKEFCEAGSLLYEFQELYSGHKFASAFTY